jgi:hypothetical protein
MDLEKAARLTTGDNFGAVASENAAHDVKALWASAPVRWHCDCNDATETEAS